MPKLIRTIIRFCSLISTGLLAAIFIATIANSVFREDSLNSPFGKSDAIEYWSAYKLWQDGENPYSDFKMIEIQRQLRDLDTPVMMWNPPWVLIIFSYIFSISSFQQFCQIWFLTSILIYILASLILIKEFAPAYIKNVPLWIFLLSFAPFLSVLALGQISNWLYLGFALLLSGIKNNRISISSIGIILLSIKPHLCLPLLALCVSEKNHFSMQKIILPSIALLFIFIGFFASLYPAVFLEWIMVVAGLSQNALVPSPQEWNTTTIIAWAQSMLNIKLNKILWTIGLTLAIYYIFKFASIARLIINEKLIFAIIILLPFGAFAWFFDYVLLSTAIIYLWPKILKQPIKLEAISLLSFISTLGYLFYISNFQQAFLLILPLSLIFGRQLLKLNL